MKLNECYRYGLKAALDAQEEILDMLAYEDETFRKAQMDGPESVNSPEIAEIPAIMKGLDFAIGAIKKHCNNIYGSNSTEIEEPCINCMHYSGKNGGQDPYRCVHCAFYYDVQFQMKEESNEHTGQD